MNLDAAKENIQPLSVGRNAALLQNALIHAENLDSQRRAFEDEIENGVNQDDPLEPWYRYLTWIEQSYPTDNKRDSGLIEVLIKCLFTFEKESRYRQDPRLIKMMVKLIDESDNPEEHYNRLYEEGIGTKVADFYISWAFHFDITGNMKRANAVYLKGIDAKAEPQDHLNEHLKHFRALSQERMFAEDEDEKRSILDKIRERRNALSTLNSIKNRVGTSRSGNPTNIRIIPNDHNDDPVQFGVVTSKGESIIQMIVDNMKKNENLVSPVSWNSRKRNKKMIVQDNALNFEILEDNSPMQEDYLNLPGKIRLPKNFVSKNLPQEPWECDLTAEDNFNVRSVLCFPLTRLYPHPWDTEYSPEEYLGYTWLKKYKPEECVPKNKYWEDCFQNGINLPLNHVDRNLFNPDDEEYELHGGLEFLKNLALPYPLAEFYQGAEEYSIEEIRAKKKHWTKLETSDTQVYDLTVEMELDSDPNIKEEVIKPPRLQASSVSKEASFKDQHVSSISSSFQKLKVKEGLENLRKENSTEDLAKSRSRYDSQNSQEEQINFKGNHSGSLLKNLSKNGSSSSSHHLDDVNEMQEELPVCPKSKFVLPAAKPCIDKPKPVFEDLDETSCNTMHFNNFIKMQFISTPIKQVPEFHSETDSSGEQLQKKLSTIIEASDSLTASTLRCNSPKIQVPRNITVESIPQVAPAKFFEEKTETIPNFMLRKGNEEKTETIPDFLLKKQNEPQALPEMSMIAPERTETINFVVKKTVKSPGNYFEEKTETIPKFTSKKKADDTIDFDEFMDIPKSSRNCTKSYEESVVFEKKSVEKKKTFSDSSFLGEFLESPSNSRHKNPVMETTSDLLDLEKTEKKTGKLSIMESTDELLDLGSAQKKTPVQRKTSEVLETTKELLNFDVSPGVAPTPCQAKDQKEFLGVSIYVEKTPIKGDRHQWNINDNAHANVEQSIRNIDYKETLNPFSVELIDQFLLEIQFYEYIENMPNFESMGNIAKLTKDRVIGINDVKFEVLKIIGEGAYGTVFLGRNTKTKELVALKQEKPPNYWEFYILLELSYRITNNDLKDSYMSACHCLVGSNASILVSKYSPYGDIIKVCNHYRNVTSKRLDEYIAMHLASQLLAVIDTLHAAEIIHADLKADNVILMSKLSYDKTVPSIQIIDFGMSIDMTLFEKGATFDLSHELMEFKCIEMREKRPWTYQTDLFGVAGIIHVMLFGVYMEVQKTQLGWKPANKVPRYYHKEVWDTIFHTLLNVKNCKSMPNLQELRALLEEVLVEKESLVKMKINEFNNILHSK